jgi:hypothetical protein
MGTYNNSLLSFLLRRPPPPLYYSFIFLLDPPVKSSVCALCAALETLPAHIYSCSLLHRPTPVLHATHCKDTIRKIRNKYLRKAKLAPSVMLLIRIMCLWAIYIQYSHDRSAYSDAGKYVDRSWEYKNHSQTHDRRNWDWGRVIPFPGIHKWDFRCNAAGRYIIYTYISSLQFT